MGTHRLVVVGGGIAGTAAALGARRVLDGIGRAEVEVLLLEERAAVGGMAQSRAREGFLVEAGPSGFLDGAGELDHLIAAAGLEKLPAEGATARRYLVRGRRARELRAHPLAFARSGILSPSGLLRLLFEPCVPRRRAGGEESVFDFAARRLGRQAAERLMQPMVQGIYAGDARALSMASTFPRLLELEREHGSLARGMIAARRAASGVAGPAGRLTSFADGLQALPRGLAAGGGFAVRTRAAVRALAYDAPDRTWRLSLEGDGEACRADSVVLALPPYAAAELLAEHAPRAARELLAIDCPPVVVVGLGFGPGSAGAVPPGFGALVDRAEGLSVIGALFESQIFPGRAPRGGLLVRALLGGALGRDVAGLSEEELVALARADLVRLFGLDARPTHVECARWPRAIPQYGLGHGARIDAIEAARVELVRARPGLHLCGSWAGGVAFARVALRGFGTGEQAARELAARLPPRT